MSRPSERRNFRAWIILCVCSGEGRVVGAGFSCTGRAREAGGGATVAAQMGFALVVCQLSLGADDSEDKLFAHGSLSSSSSSMN